MLCMLYFDTRCIDLTEKVFLCNAGCEKMFVHDFDSSSINLTRLSRRTHCVPQELQLRHSVTAVSLMSLW